MKAIKSGFPMAVWAGREILRHPGRNLLLALALAMEVFLVSTVLLFSQALDTTWERLLENTPDLVVRRVNSGGWTPLPVEEALASAGKVPGVLNPTPRIWAAVEGPTGPVTVVASAAVLPDGAAPRTPPATGEALVGPAVAGAIMDGHLTLGKNHPVRLAVTGILSASTGLATHDLVWMNAQDARRLLGLSEGQASDLAIYLFHPEEEKAILADLGAAFPWPVTISARSTAKWRHHASAIHTGARALTFTLPALLALVFIVSAIAVEAAGQRVHWGILKSLGWGTQDLVRLQLTKALIAGAPAVALGLSAAYTAVFYPPVAGVTAHWITGGRTLSELTLASAGAPRVMLLVAALVVLPCLSAVFLAALREAKNEFWLLPLPGPWN